MMTPYCFYKLPFEEQLKQVSGELLQDWEFNKHSMENRKKLLLAENINWVEFERLLLSIGGTKVCFTYEFHLKELLTRGRKYAGKSTSDKGEPSNCHGNTANLWSENDPKDFKIVTGWALTKNDGMWRQHTWGRWMDSVTIETTVKRQKYYGFELNLEESQRFALCNSWEYREKIEAEMLAYEKSQNDTSKDSP